jgi:hypothetical protein
MASTRVIALSSATTSAVRRRTIRESLPVPAYGVALVMRVRMGLLQLYQCRSRVEETEWATSEAE